MFCTTGNIFQQIMTVVACMFITCHYDQCRNIVFCTPAVWGLITV